MSADRTRRAATRPAATRGRQLIALAAAASALAGCSTSDRKPESFLPPKPATAEAPVLTHEGRLLMQFEALLLRTFKTTNVSASGEANFSCAGDCSPLSKYRLYRFTFSHPVGSAFRLGPRHLGNVSFGNYPFPVRVKGRYVRCAPKKYLIAYATAVSFTLACLPPQQP